MEELNQLIDKKKGLERQILKGRSDFYYQYNQVCLQMLKVQSPIRFP